MNYTYMLKCSDGTLYTGWTNDLEKRVEAHNSGKGAKYTKARRPVELAYYEEFETKEQAMKREWDILQPHLLQVFPVSAVVSLLQVQPAQHLEQSARIPAFLVNP